MQIGFEGAFCITASRLSAHRGIQHTVAWGLAHRGDFGLPTHL